MPTINMPDGSRREFYLDKVDELIARASDHLDESIRYSLDLDTHDLRHRALLLRIRVDKNIEEVGEAHRAIIGAEGSNPRKGVTHSEIDIADELLDQALTALLAYYHVTQQEYVLERFAAHLTRKVRDYYGIEA